MWGEEGEAIELQKDLLPSHQNVTRWDVKFADCQLDLFTEIYYVAAKLSICEKKEKNVET